MHRVSKLKLAEVTPYLVCKLCNGYFIDPCTAQDCLHTFCKTCIVKHLYQHCTCPICDVVIHKTRPLEMIRHDQTIQDLVYKLVPGVFGKEMERRREFYSDHPDPDVNGEGNSEERGEVKDDREILAEDDSISMALVHSPNGEAKLIQPSTEEAAGPATIYLRCPATFTVSGIKKLLRAKFDLALDFLIDVFHSDESLSDDYTLMDVAYIYTWRRRGPLKVFYTIYQFDPVAAEQHKLAPTTPTPSADTRSTSVFELSDTVTITELVKTAERKQLPGATNSDPSLISRSKELPEAKNQTLDIPFSTSQNETSANDNITQSEETLMEVQSSPVPSVLPATGVTAATNSNSGVKADDSL